MEENSEIQKSPSEVDYTSALTIDILQKILLCLSSADQFYASLVSSSWKSAYDSLTILDVDPASFKERINRSNKVFSRDLFQNFVEEIIQRKCANLLTLKISMWYYSCDDSWMNRFMGLLPKNSLEVLKLNLDSFEEYELPDDILELSCLKILKLKLCKFIFDKSSLGDRIQFINLKVLKLVFVNIDDFTLYEIIRRCPMITNLELITCNGLQNLQIWSLPNQFKSVKVETRSELFKSIEIKSYTLQSFYYSGPVVIAPVLTCNNLVDLILKSWTVVTVDENKFESVISKFPLLNTLVLDFRNGMPKLRITNPNLKMLKIRQDCGLREAHIHAPSLEELNISLSLDDKDHLKSLIFIDAANLQKFKLKLKQSRFLNKDDCEKFYTSWFIELREFLQQFVHKVILTMRFDALQPMWNPDDTSICGLPPTAIEHLNVDIVWNFCGNYGEFLDGLFWSCHPNSFSVEIMSDLAPVFFLQTLSEIIETEDDPTLSCCKSSLIKCWRHYLKSYQLRHSHDGKIINCKDYLRFAIQYDPNKSADTEFQFWGVMFDFSFLWDQ
ncbi:hypothetical protein ACFE04_022706 [Oxalis oulophora]